MILKRPGFSSLPVCGGLRADQGRQLSEEGGAGRGGGADRHPGHGGPGGLRGHQRQLLPQRRGLPLRLLHHGAGVLRGHRRLQVGRRRDLPLRGGFSLGVWPSGLRAHFRSGTRETPAAAPGVRPPGAGAWLLAIPRPSACPRPSPCPASPCAVLTVSLCSTEPRLPSALCSARRRGSDPWGCFRGGSLGPSAWVTRGGHSAGLLPG